MQAFRVATVKVSLYFTILQFSFCITGLPVNLRRVLVAQYVKRWPTDLALPGSSSAGGGDLIRIVLHTVFRYQPPTVPKLLKY